MSVVDYTEPPAPPPPPPPPPGSSSTSFDFVQPFAFVFQDERWVQKVLIGGLFYIAAFILIGLPFILGYCARLTRNVINGLAKPLPEWDDLGSFFADGVKLFCVGLIYFVPIIAIVLAVMIPAGILTAIGDQIGEHHAGGDLAQFAGGTAMTCVWCLFFPLSLAMSFWLPGAITFAIVEDRIGAAFQFGRIFNYIKGNFVNYLLAFVVYLVARFAVPFGMILLCIGVVFTAFWSFLVAAYAFGYAYRLSPVK